MSFASADAWSKQDGRDAVRKMAQRQRLAAALRANLGRRKAQSRDRRESGSVQSDALHSDADQSVAAADQNANETGN
jgi:hypothetical protein